MLSVANKAGVNVATIPAVPFHAPGWAAHYAVYLLSEDAFHKFEIELRRLFDDYKKGKGKWITYNEEKRVLLHKYLSVA